MTDVPVVADVEAAMPYAPTTLLVGVAPAGGKLPPAFRRSILQAIERGLDVESGLHEFLADDAEIAAAAARAGVELRDLRRVPADLDVPTGANLTVATHTVLTVGSDCALGKMTVCLELHREARRRELASVFVPTGQTGIAIAGWGIAVDQVISDYVAGASEQLVIEGHARRRGRRDPLDRGPGLDQPSLLLGSHARPPARLGAARDGVRARAGARADRRRSALPDRQPAGADRRSRCGWRGTSARRPWSRWR